MIKPMNYLALLFILIFFISSKSFSQDTLLRYDKETKKVYEGKKEMNMDNLFKLMRPNKETFELIVSARDCKFYSNVFAIPGGLVIGFPIGSFLITNNFNWPVFAIGAGLIGISIPLHLRYVKQRERAIKSYNESLNLSEYRKEQIDFSLIGNQNGIGVRLTF